MSKKAFRFVIEGMGTQWVSFPSQTQTLADGRVRRTGLMLQGPDGEPVTLGIEVDMARGEIEGDGFTIHIANTDGHATNEFYHLAEIKNWLTGQGLDPGDQTIPMPDTAGFTGLSVVHIGTEAISVTGETFGTLLLIDQRGYWDTITQTHYTDTGANLRTNAVQNRPETIEGRRCFLYEYTASDDHQGDGTLIWRGVCATDAKFDGTSYSILVDPITALLKKPLGSELEDPVSIRGIYYHDRMDAPLRITLGELNGPSRGDTLTSGNTYVELSDLSAYTGREAFYETQEEFCEDVNAAISSAIAGWDVQPEVLKLVPSGNDYDVIFRPGVDGGGDPHWVSFGLGSSLDGRFRTVFGWLRDRDDKVVLDVEEGVNYRSPKEASVMRNNGFQPSVDKPRTVPRVAWNYTGGAGDKLHLSGIIPVADRYKEIQVKVGDGASIIAEITSSSTSSRWVRAKSSAFSGLGSDLNYYFSSANVPEIHLTRSYTARNVAEIIDEITDDAPSEVNRKGGPGLYNADVNQIEMTALMFNKIFHELRIAQRRYTFATKINVDELLAHEFRLIGAYPTVDEDHKLTMRVLGMPAGTDPDITDIGSSEVLIDERYPETEKHARGMLDEAALKTRYDPFEDEHKGRVYQVHNVRATSRNHNAKTLKVEPKSIQLAADTHGVTYEEAAQSLAPVLGLFGAPYALVTVDAKAEKSGDLVRVGNPVAISHHAIPDWQSGTLGVDSLPGVVMGRRWQPTRGRVTYKILTTGIDVAGYAPSLGVTSQTNVQDSIWNVNVRLGDPLGITDWSDTSKYDASDFYEPGYQIRVKKWNSSTVNPVAGTVNGVNGNTLVIDFDSTWTPGSDLWTVEFENADEATSGQQAYAYFAGSDRRIDFSQPRKAREFAP